MLDLLEVKPRHDIYIYIHLFMYIYIYNGDIIGFNGDVSKTHQGINQPFDGDMFWDI